MRQILLNLAKEAKFPQTDDIFYLKFNELTDLKENRKLYKLKTLAIERKVIYQKRLEEEPKFKIEA